MRTEIAAMPGSLLLSYVDGRLRGLGGLTEFSKVQRIKFYGTCGLKSLVTCEVKRF